MPCSCWYVTENGNLERRACTDKQQEVQQASKNPVCGFVEGTLRRPEAKKVLQQMRRKVKEKGREEKERQRVIQQEDQEDLARFITEVNHGRTPSR